MRKKLSYVCSTLRENGKRLGLNFLSRRTWCGMDICRRRVRDNYTDTGCQGLILRSKGSVLITTNFFLTPTANKFRAQSIGPIRTLDTSLAIRMKIYLLTGAMTPRECRRIE